METGSDHEVIQFELTANESEWVESPLNASYNIVKADWPKFAETLQILSSQIENQIQNLMQTPSNANLEEIAILFRNLIVNAADQYIPKRRSSSRAKVWWSESLSTLRAEMSGFKRYWKYNKTEENWNQFTHARNRYFHAIQKAKQTS